jgi:LPS-assembly protein
MVPDAPQSGQKPGTAQTSPAAGTTSGTTTGTPAGTAATTSATTAKIPANPAPGESINNQADPTDMFSGTPTDPGPDPMFSLPATQQAAPVIPVMPAEPTPDDETLRSAPAAVEQETPVVDTGIAIPIEAPPVGTPVHIEATTQGKTGDKYTLDGKILILYRTYRVQADHAVYNTATGDVVARGHVTVDGGPSDEHLVADHGTMNLDAHTGHFYGVTGTLGVRTVTHDRFVFTSPNPFALTGRELIELGPGRYQVLQGTMTSCRLPDPDWQLLARNILIDDKVAHANNTEFTLFHVPLFYLPYVSHPVEEQHRQSGILLPIFGSDTQRGLIAGESGYLVLGRSADATIGSEYFSKRGFGPFGQVRYRGAGQDFATLRFRSLLDRLSGTANQGGVDVIADARRDLDAHTRAVADGEYLSSYVYRQAFEELYSAAINSEVKSSAYVTTELNAFAASGVLARYQNFRSDNPGDEIRVLHTPELQLDAMDQHIGRTPLLWGGAASAGALSRSEPSFQTSRLLPRLDIYPHLALPLEADGWHVRAEAGVRDTFYGKSQQPGLPGDLPIAERGEALNRKAFTGEISLHSPTLERDYAGGFLQRFLHNAEVRHTIEPEVTYRYATGVNHYADTLRFDATDILTNTNEVEYGLTQRLFLRHLHKHPCKGDEALGPDRMCGGGTEDWLTWTVAQKHFFDPRFGGAVVDGERNVFTTTLDLTGAAFVSGPRRASPILSRLRMRTTSTTDVEWDLDYDARSGRVQASNLFSSYRKGNYFFSLGDSRLFNIIPRVTTLPDAPSANPNSTSTQAAFNQLHLAAIYGSPKKPGFSAGMNLGYDLTQAQTQYLGTQVSYNRDCCGFAFETRRYSLGTVRDDTQYLFSFTLAGVGSAGSLRPVDRVF